MQIENEKQELANEKAQKQEAEESIKMLAQQKS